PMLQTIGVALNPAVPYVGSSKQALPRGHPQLLELALHTVDNETITVESIETALPKVTVPKVMVLGNCRTRTRPPGEMKIASSIFPCEACVSALAPDAGTDISCLDMTAAPGPEQDALGWVWAGSMAEESFTAARRLLGSPWSPGQLAPLEGQPLAEDNAEAVGFACGRRREASQYRLALG
ncbi:unnamed protein product, partial [Rangifer tarandus platyrhynchus]